MRYLQRPWLPTALCAMFFLLPAGTAVSQQAQEFADSANEVASYFEGKVHPPPALSFGQWGVFLKRQRSR